MFAPISHSYRINEQLSVNAIISSKWRLLRISAAVEEVAVTAEVAQDEVVVTADDEVQVDTELGLVEEEDKREEEVLDNGEGEGLVSTKLYFGNLPYSVDSAQLAGLIQDFGSPELIEVSRMQYFPP
jgi:hypothetical protein